MSSSFKERMKMFQKAAEENKPSTTSHKYSVKKGISEKTNKNNANKKEDNDEFILKKSQTFAQKNPNSKNLSIPQKEVKQDTNNSKDTQKKEEPIKKETTPKKEETPKTSQIKDDNKDIDKNVTKENKDKKEIKENKKIKKQKRIKKIKIQKKKK